MVSFKKQLTAKEKSDVILSSVEFLNSESSDKNIISIIEELVKALLTVSYARLWILDKDKSTLYSKTISELEEVKIPLYKGLLGKVTMDNEIFYVNDVTSNYNYVESVDNFEQNEIKDMILMPIIKDKDIIYIIQAMTSKENIRQFTNSDIETFKMIVPYIQNLNLDSIKNINSSDKKKENKSIPKEDHSLLSKVFALFN